MSPDHFQRWFPTFCKQAAEGCESDDFGDMILNTQQAFTWAKRQFIGRVMIILGADPSDQETWPFKYSRVTFDDYDQSFEFKEIEQLDFEFTAEQWDQIKSLGFECAWLCFVDGSERIYPSRAFKPAPDKVESP